MCHGNKEGEIKVIELIFPSNHWASIYSDTVSLSNRFFFTCAIVQVRSKFNDSSLGYQYQRITRSEPVAMTQDRTKHVTLKVSLPPTSHKPNNKGIVRDSVVQPGTEVSSGASHTNRRKTGDVFTQWGKASLHFIPPHSASSQSNLLGPAACKTEKKKGRRKKDTSKRKCSQSVQFRSTQFSRVREPFCFFSFVSVRASSDEDER